MPRRETSLASILAGSASASFRRLNAHLFAGASGPVGGLPCAVAEPDRRDAAAHQDRGEAAGQGSVRRSGRARDRHGARATDRSSPRVRVHLCSYRRPGRPLDRDNLIGGNKHVRDAIARWLGLDDAERFIEWEYSQVETRGALGVSVRIETIA